MRECRFPRSVEKMFFGDLEAVFCHEGSINIVRITMNSVRPQLPFCDAQRSRTIPYNQVQDELRYIDVRIGSKPTWCYQFIPWISRLSSLNSASISLIFASIVSRISGRYNWQEPGCLGVGWAGSSGRQTLELELSLARWLHILAVSYVRWKDWASLEASRFYTVS